jgi:hypothetical protein
VPTIGDTVSRCLARPIALNPLIFPQIESGLARTRRAWESNPQTHPTAFDLHYPETMFWCIDSHHKWKSAERENRKRLDDTEHRTGFDVR